MAANLVLIAYASSEGSGEPPLLAHKSPSEWPSMRSYNLSLRNA